MSDPTGPDAIETVKHVAGTAGGGGLVAAVIEFFRGRERAAVQSRVAALEARVNALEGALDKLAPRRWSSGAVNTVRPARRTSPERSPRKK